jgi:hypothetical protein
MDPAAVLGSEIFKRQRIGDSTRVESGSLISNYEDHSLAGVTAAADMNQLADL